MAFWNEAVGVSRYLIDKGLEEIQLGRDRGSLLRLLFLECRGNLTVLDAVLDDLRAREGSPSEEQLVALSTCISVDVLGSLFVMGGVEHRALTKLRKTKITKDDPEKAVSDALASVFVRAQAVMRLATLRGSGLGTRVDFPRRLSNLRDDYLAVVKALGSTGWAS